MSRRRTLVVVVGLLISAAALWLVVQSIDVFEAVDIVASADPLPVAAIVGVVAVQVVFRARRWSILLPTRDGQRIPTRRLLPPMLTGYLGNAVLPARLGEAIRAVVVSRRETAGTTEALGSVLVERVIDVATLAPVAFVAALLVMAPEWVRQALGAAAIVGIGGVGILVTVGLQPLVRLGERLGLLSRPRVRQVVTRFVATLGGPARRPALLAAAAISIAAWLLDATSFWLASRAVGADLTYAGALLVAGVAVLGTAIPSAPGYVGTFELAAAGTATALGVPGPEALALAVVAHVMTLVPMALGGAVSLVMMGANFGEVVHAAEGRPPARG